MSPILQVMAQSERGRRPQNEDMFAVPGLLYPHPLPERGLAIVPHQRVQFSAKGFLYLVADGVGGYDGGEKASALAVSEVSTRYYEDPSLDLETSLIRVIQAAHRQIRLHRQIPGEPPNMCTTLTAALIQGNKLILAQAGDTRAYLIRNRQAQRLTKDHSWVQAQVDQGLLTPDEAKVTKHKNRITRALGKEEQIGIDTERITLLAGDRVLLCSDGVSNHLSEQELATLAGQKHLNKAVNNLLDTAYDNGSTDNMTVVLIDFHKQETHWWRRK